MYTRTCIFSEVDKMVGFWQLLWADRRRSKLNCEMNYKLTAATTPLASLSLVTLSLSLPLISGLTTRTTNCNQPTANKLHT